MPNYQNGKIYGIYYQKKLRYIGSTTQTLALRMGKHRTNARNIHMTGDIYKEMRENGIENYYIELIENYPCNTVEELHKKEGECQRLDFDNICNQLIAGRSKEEFDSLPETKIKKREYNLKYREQNKEKLIEYDRKRQQTEERKQSDRERHLKNKEKRNKLCSDRYKERNAIKIKCECGQEIIPDCYKKHLQSKQHYDDMNK